MNQKINERLIKSAIEGDPVAFRKIYLALYDSIYGFCFRMLGEKSVAEDITQEVFVFFIENSKKYKIGRGSLLSFLCGVARNRIMHHLRKSGNRREISREDMSDFYEPEDETGYSPLENLLEKELEVKISECLSELPPLQREAIILREMQGLSYEEIAKVTGANVNAVVVRLHRARQNLMQRLAPYLNNSKESNYEMH